MDKKTQILTILLTITVVFSIVATFYKYILMEDIVYETDEDAFQAALLEE